MNNSKNILSLQPMKTNLLIVFAIIMLFTSCDNKPSRAEYAGEDLSDKSRIFRDTYDKTAYLMINETGKWSLYSGTSVESIDFSKPLLEGEGIRERLPLQVPDSVRSYFQLVTEHGKAILAEKHLPMKGGYNFRDLGGLRTTEGRYVKWGKILRSDDLSFLTESDLAYLSSLPLISVVDFRSEGEVSQSSDRLPETVTGHYAYSITPGNLGASIADLFSLTESKGDSLMQEINLMLVSDTANIKRYKEYFALLHDEKNVPLLFHCSAGKDRTGMAAALTLFALGVDEETIMSDYLASNIYLREKYREYTVKHPELTPLFVVKASYIQTGIEWIKKEYGTVEEYLDKVLDVDRDKLKRIYLY